jgi:EAL domain-containing protein (putative c-di-GMP-specific phosphodiesterase class I)
MCGVEALIRWQSPELGLVQPCEFIPVLEQTGLILEVGRWALQRAVADANCWLERGFNPHSIGVNVSAIQLSQKDFVQDVTASIAAGKGSAKWIEIELTESMLMSDVETNVEKLGDIRKAGIKIAIDDFGTGYSSLNYLARLPLDTLKIDRSFVAPMNTSPVHKAIVTTVISLARSLNLRIVAEGVESNDQADLLRSLRCDEAQGYLYSRPVPEQEIGSALKSPRTDAAVQPDREERHVRDLDLVPSLAASRRERSRNADRHVDRDCEREKIPHFRAR